jgi:uncharacterized protein (TIGR02246 family)
VLAILVGVPAAPSYGQTAASEINRVYRQFVEAHDALDADQIAPLYAAGAHNLNANGEEGVRTGRDAILENVRSLFEKARERGSDLSISFRIIDREIDGRLAYDVGYYRYESVPPEGEPVRGAGKFAAVLRRGSDGQWRFVVDAAGKAPLTAFDEAETVAQIP